MNTRIQTLSEKLDCFLKASGLPVQFFCHDRTFGNSGVALISSNANIPLYYYQKKIPLIFTNDMGRTLNDGVYLSQYFLDPVLEYEKLQIKLKKCSCLTIAWQ